MNKNNSILQIPDAPYVKQLFVNYDQETAFDPT